MIECILTLDYEIYGDGSGGLKDLVYEPTQRFASILREHGVPFVLFVETSEFEMIEREGADAAIATVRDQVRRLRDEGTEIGLHLHPWWYNATYQQGRWSLDYSEYNMCALSEGRVSHMIDRALAYLREMLGDSTFTPLVHRAGHLLFHPSDTYAATLAGRGVTIDSSVYKGGVWGLHDLDYRRALRNGHYWRFDGSSCVPAPNGRLLEIPVHSRMVPTWTMLTAKRIALQPSVKTQSKRRLAGKLRELARFRRPLKLDFCQMTIEELRREIDHVRREDERQPNVMRPVVAIGHSKDLVDFDTVAAFLGMLREREIPVSTFAGVAARCA